MFVTGTKVMIVGGDLYLGRWIRAGTRGVITGYYHSLANAADNAIQTLYEVQLENGGGVAYHIAPAELQEVSE